MAVNALGVIGDHDFRFGVVVMDTVCALPFADPAADAAVLVPDHFKFRI
jgi:hypothetical protein